MKTSSRLLLFPLLRSPFVAALYLLFGAWTVGHAHQPGNSSLNLELQADGSLRGEYHVAYVDLESLRLMVKDRVARGALAADEAKAAETLPWLHLSVNGESVPFTVRPPEEAVTDGDAHLMIPFQTATVEGLDLTVSMVDFFEFDPRHIVVLDLTQETGNKIGIITRDELAWTVSLSEPGAWHQFLVFTWEGVWHIWIGIDHILFLIALLLPSVLRRDNGKWHPVDEFGAAMKTVIKVVTAFTVAHSITLSLAALHIVSLPSKWVESVIAISVVLAALNNIFPVVKKKTWLVAGAFGLIHGFGFANVLADLALPAGTLALALLSFNVGVELGQLAIVVVVFPFLYLVERRPIFLPTMLHACSAAIALIATGWVFDRVFELGFMPF